MDTLQSEDRAACMANTLPDEIAEPLGAIDEPLSGVKAAEEASSGPEAATSTESWRDLVNVHSAADLFPMMSEDELRALGKDIKENGLREPIALFRPYEGGPLLLLDGRNRLAAIELAFEDPEERAKCLEDALDGAKVVDRNVEPEAYVVSANIQRRHLTSEQKRELITTFTKRHPDWSDRAIGDLAKADHKTVAAVRAKAEARGEIPHAEMRTDTKGRPQPAHKAASSGQSRAKPSGQVVRDAWVTSFLTTFHAKPFATLDDLPRMLKDEGKWLGDISREKRLSLARGFLEVLDVSPAELQGQDGGGER